jgi:hypothetical protein
MSRSSEGSAGARAPRSVLMPPSVSAAPAPPARVGGRTDTLAEPFLGRATGGVEAAPVPAATPVAAAPASAAPLLEPAPEAWPAAADVMAGAVVPFVDAGQAQPVFSHPEPGAEAAIGGPAVRLAERVESLARRIRLDGEGALREALGQGEPLEAALAGVLLAFLPRGR